MNVGCCVHIARAITMLQTGFKHHCSEGSVAKMCCAYGHVVTPESVSVLRIPGSLAALAGSHKGSTPHAPTAWTISRAKNTSRMENPHLLGTWLPSLVKQVAFRDP